MPSTGIKLSLILCLIVISPDFKMCMDIIVNYNVLVNLGCCHTRCAFTLGVANFAQFAPGHRQAWHCQDSIMTSQ